MDAIGFGYQRNIQPIIDQDTRLERSGGLDNLPSEFREGVGLEISFPDLNQSAASLDSFPNAMHECLLISCLMARSLAEHLAIGDQIDERALLRQSRL